MTEQFLEANRAIIIFRIFSILAVDTVGGLVHETGARATDYDADRGIRALRAARAPDAEQPELHAVI